MKRQDKGLLIVNTGDGKGKTTSALGVALRTLGYGGKVYLLYFMKEVRLAERAAFERHGDEIVIEQSGAGFYKLPGDHATEEEHRKKVREAMQKASKAIESGKFELVILDEVLNAIDVGLLTNQEVLQLVRRRGKVNVIVTGRNARKGMIAAADLVSEVRKVKHPFDKGIYARRGIDF